MLCTKCNQPLLERYNGQPFCPQCGKSSFDDKLRITAEGERLFRLSELCYLRILSPLPAELAISDPKALLADAIRLCAAAAADGHPKAVFRLGYYYEFYQKEELGEIERVQRAFEYYWRLCNPEIKKSLSAMLQPGVLSDSIQNEGEWNDLRATAAQHILQLFAMAPEAFSGSADGRYQRARRALESAYSSIDATPLDEAQGEALVGQIYRTLSSCFRKRRPPLLGLFKLKGTELRQLLSLRASAAEGRRHEMRVLCEDLLFHYLVCKEDGTLLPRQRAFARIRGAEFPAAVRDEDHVYLFFFNERGRHEHITTRSLRRVKREVLDDQKELLDYIGGSSRKNLILFHEDVVYMERVLKGNFAKLIDNICEEG